MSTRMLARLVFVVMTALIPAQASAACAWVLWSAIWDDKQSEYQYRYVDAFVTKAACDDEASFRNRNINELKQRDPTARLGVVQCVPDTIDPRGPKR